MIWQLESKKLIKHPFVWCLFFFFLLYNVFTIWNNVGDSYKEIQQLHNDILEYGIDEDFYQTQLNHYDTLDMKEIQKTKQALMNYYPTGAYKEFINSNYEKLNERVEEIKQTGEDEGNIYPGLWYNLHNTFYTHILRPVLLENAIFMILCILFLMDYERINKTNDLVYSSNIGRRIQVTKWMCGLCIGLFFGLALMTITFLVWFLLIPYKEFFDVSMSAAVLTESRSVFLYPFITYEKMTVSEYLIATILFSILLFVIVGMITGALQLLLQNSYISFLSIIILLLVGCHLSSITFVNWIDIALSWNLAYLWYTSGYWFMENSLYTSFQGTELLNAGVQIFIWGSIGLYSYKRFMRGTIR